MAHVTGLLGGLLVGFAGSRLSIDFLRRRDVQCVDVVASTAEQSGDAGERAEFVFNQNGYRVSHVGITSLAKVVVYCNLKNKIQYIKCKNELALP